MMASKPIQKTIQTVALLSFVLLLTGRFKKSPEPDLSVLTIEEKQAKYAELDQLHSEQLSKPIPIPKYQFIQPTSPSGAQVQIEKGEGLVYLYFGFSECPACQAFTPKLNAIQSLYPQTVYFIDTSSFQQETVQSDIERKYLDDLLEDYDIQYVPTLLVFKNGKLINRLDNQSTMQEIEDAFASQN